MDGDRPERRLYAVAPRRAEDRRREGLTEVFRTTWDHGVNGQAQVINGMQQIIHSYTLLQDKEAMSEAGRGGGCPAFRGTSVAAPMIRPLAPPPDPRTIR